MILRTALWPRIIIRCFILAAVLLPDDAEAVKGRYSIGDWVSWTSMRHINDMEEHFNVLYLATDGGIARYDIQRRRWLRPLTMSDGLAARRISAIAIDAATMDIVYRTADGRGHAFMLLNETDNPYYIPTPEMERRLDESTSGGPYGTAITPPGYAFYPDGILTEHSLRTYMTVDAVIDFWDNMWLAFRGFGIGMRDDETGRMRLLPYSLWNDNLSAVGHYGDNFWFVGPGAINVHHRDLDAWAKFEAFHTSELVGDIAQDVIVDSSRVWIATTAGLSRYDGRTRRWRTFRAFDGLPDNNVTCIARSDSSVWIGTTFGVARLDLTTRTVKDVSSGDARERAVHDIALMGDTVWVGTDAGLFRSRDNGRTWLRFTGQQAILDAPVYVVEVDGTTVWCASRMGIAGYNTASATWERFPLPHYFVNQMPIDSPSPDFYSILSDGSYLWVGTDRGVFKYDRARGYWRQFTIEDGLIDNRVMDIELDEDYIWFATPGGATRFYWNNPLRAD